MASSYFVERMVRRNSRIGDSYRFVQNLYLLSAFQHMQFQSPKGSHRQRRDWIDHSIRLRTYTQRDYILSLFSNTTRNSYQRPFRVLQTEAARQGPALGVTPVLMPVHPSPSILFVFYHRPIKTDLSRKRSERMLGSMFYLSVQGLSMYSQRQLCAWVDTIRRNYWFRMEQVQSLQTSRAVEQLEVLERPWGLAKLLQVMPMAHERRFISLRKSVTLLDRVSKMPSLHTYSQIQGYILPWSRIRRRRVEPTYAIRQAASLPLGSIIPKYKSYSEQTAPYLISAVVPIIAQLFFDALTLICLASSPDRSTSSRIVMRFIILVRLAISLFLQFLFPQRHRFSFISQSIQLFADTSGISVLSSNACENSSTLFPFLSPSAWQDLFLTLETETDLHDSLSLFNDTSSSGISSCDSIFSSRFEIVFLLEKGLACSMAITEGQSEIFWEGLLGGRGGNFLATCIDNQISQNKLTLQSGNII